jgi:hypothetical protein
MSTKSRRLALSSLLYQIQQEQEHEQHMLTSAALRVLDNAAAPSSLGNTLLAYMLQKKHAIVAVAAANISLTQGRDSFSNFLPRALTTSRMTTRLENNVEINDDPTSVTYSGGGIVGWGLSLDPSMSVRESSDVDFEKLRTEWNIVKRATALQRELLSAVQAPHPSPWLDGLSSKYGTTTTTMSPSLLKRPSDVNRGKAGSKCKVIEETTGRPPVILYLPNDDEALSGYQCFIRKQIEFFEANDEDVSSNAKGRNKPIVLGQVGIRCRHCSSVSPKCRTRGAMYYPKKMILIYQAAQSVACTHLNKGCPKAPEEIKFELAKLHNNKSLIGGGKAYWDKAAAAVGVHETINCLRFNVQIQSR